VKNFRRWVERPVSLLTSEPGPHGWAARPESAQTVLLEALSASRDAAQTVSHFMEGPCAASDYASVRLAQPLILAAVSLLGWRAGQLRPPPAHPQGRFCDLIVIGQRLGRARRSTSLLLRLWPDAAIRQASALLEDAAACFDQSGIGMESEL
jgi:hypothetical protein